MYPIADISVDFMNTMAKQKSLSYIVFFSAEFRNTLVQRPILTIKGIVSPKMKILSSFTQVVPTLYEYFFSDEHKIRYFEESL